LPRRWADQLATQTTQAENGGLPIWQHAFAISALLCLRFAVEFGGDGLNKEFREGRNAACL
jgi:hypothetical protein